MYPGPECAIRLCAPPRPRLGGGGGGASLPINIYLPPTTEQQPFNDINNNFQLPTPVGHPNCLLRLGWLPASAKHAPRERTSGIAMPAAAAEGSGVRRLNTAWGGQQLLATPFAPPHLAPRSHRPQDSRSVQTQAAFHWSVPLQAMDLATVPPQTEIVFALQQRGIGMLECLATLQEAPSLSTSKSAALEVAACLAQPFVIEVGGGWAQAWTGC